MKNKKYWLITSAITLVPILLGLILWNKLPDQLPPTSAWTGPPTGGAARDSPSSVCP